MLKKTLLTLLLALLLFIAYTLVSTGFFRTVTDQFAGEVIDSIALTGAEDITTSEVGGFAIISATDRGIYPPQEEEFGDLYYLDLTADTLAPRNLTADFPGSFAPHGISMYAQDSSYRVLAINHTPAGHSIAAFTLRAGALMLDDQLTDPSMISPNDVVLVDAERFYFTNDHGYTKGIGRFLEEYGNLAVSNVVYFDGDSYREVAGGIAYANGINIDRARQLLYVASPRRFLFKVYRIEPNGDLTFVENIPCGTGVDNIEIAPDGTLWIGAHPNLLGFAAYAQGKRPTAPSEILRIDYRGEGDYTVESVFSDDGDLLSASTVASPYRDRLLVGTVMDEWVLVLGYR
jgi:arylesterase/paraoxonase